jgi:hypothetical protein
MIKHFQLTQTILFVKDQDPEGHVFAFAKKKKKKKKKNT